MLIHRIVAACATAGILLLLLCSLAGAQDRASAAHGKKDTAVRAAFREKNIPYPPDEIFFRAFKSEPGKDFGIVELWARDGAMKQFKLVKTYDVCYASGGPGPKRAQGDGQVPEGFYTISGWNPASSYHLSMRISYPNESDKILGARGNPGGDIFIHGRCVSIGCLAMTDDKIDELYIIALDVKNHSRRPINFHIFPLRMNDAGMKTLRATAAGDPKLLSFWQNLKTGYDTFEESRVPPKVSVDKKGVYHFNSGK